jgi:hypothetical protein
MKVIKTGNNTQTWWSPTHNLRGQSTPLSETAFPNDNHQRKNKPSNLELKLPILNHNSSYQFHLFVNNFMQISVYMSLCQLYRRCYHLKLYTMFINFSISKKNWSSISQHMGRILIKYLQKPSLWDTRIPFQNGSKDIHFFLNHGSYT